jgi:hypothetical protein
VTRALRLLAVAAAFAALAAVAGSAAADNPFYLVPSVTKECEKVSHCRSVSGPWVSVPATGEATFLFGCPERRGFMVGGTDARASSGEVRVWFDGRLGAPIGVPKANATQAAVVLFHAATSNGRIGSFQPLLGCVSLAESSKRATESARVASALPGKSPSAPADLRAEMVELNLATGLAKNTTTLGCPAGERPVSSWSALALNTTTPPSARYERAITIRARIVGRRVVGTFRTARLFGYLAPEAWAQVGAVCEP